MTENTIPQDIREEWNGIINWIRQVATDMDFYSERFSVALYKNLAPILYKPIIPFTGDIKEWIEKEADTIFYNQMSPKENKIFKRGATALYAHLKPLIDGTELIAIERGKAIEELQDKLDAKDKEIDLFEAREIVWGTLRDHHEEEIERLKGLIENAWRDGWWESSDEHEQNEYWQSFKYKNNL